MTICKYCNQERRVEAQELEIRTTPTVPHKHGLSVVTDSRDPAATNNVAGNFVGIGEANSTIYASGTPRGRGVVKITHSLPPTDPDKGANAAGVAIDVAGDGNKARLFYSRPTRQDGGDYVVIRRELWKALAGEILMIHRSERIGLGTPINAQPKGRLEINQSEPNTAALVLTAAPGSTAPLLRIESATGSLELMPDLTWRRNP